MERHSYTGLGAFGAAYEVMLRHDAHAPGSVDRVLQETMVRLCAATADVLYAGPPAAPVYARGTRPVLEARVEAATSGHVGAEARIAAIARHTAGLADTVPDDVEATPFGGTEEAILARGCDWCTDVARVAVTLYQVAGLPARVVFLADVDTAYCGHAIAEVFRHGSWGAVDTSTGIVYRRGAEPASVWALMGDADLVRAHGPAAYTHPAQFRAAAIAEYAVAERSRYDYTESGVNDYYRSILAMAARGWPGGLRWLHGEDRA